MTTMVYMPEELWTTPEVRGIRQGRFMIAELLVPHLVISTSVRNGGQRNDLRFLMNHQSCEGAAHRERYDFIHEIGQEAYHDHVAKEAGVDPAAAAIMGTAANMNYSSVVSRRDDEVAVTAVVTGGVETNAVCAGDPAAWQESAGNWTQIPVAGTINTMLIINHPLTPSALARAVVTMTEGKSAALQRLAVRSRYSPDYATGTGTDQYCVAAVLDEMRPPLTSASTHGKLGELIGRAVRDATLEALRWQNGLEASYTRSIFHALRSTGLRESSFFDDVAPYLSANSLELLQRNAKSAFYEPLVSAAAYGIAAVLDRVRYGTMPAAAGSEALRQQAATLAASLAGQPDRWPYFHEKLRDRSAGPVESLLLRAIALGWSEKWR